MVDPVDDVDPPPPELDAAAAVTPAPPPLATAAVVTSGGGPVDEVDDDVAGSLVAVVPDELCLVMIVMSPVRVMIGIFKPSTVTLSMIAYCSRPVSSTMRSADPPLKTSVRMASASVAAIELSTPMRTRAGESGSNRIVLPPPHVALRTGKLSAVV